MTDCDTRALLSRMADELDHYRQLLSDDRREVHALAAEARAVLARWGRPSAPPAPEVGEQPVSQPYKLPEPGEVEELAEELNQIAGSLNDDGFFHSCDQLWRAATLLKQLSAPASVVVPVAVSERLPGEGEA